MTVQCITCKHFSLRESPLARQGFGRCAFGRAWELMSAVYRKSCVRHSEQTPDAVIKRREWLEARR